MKKMIILLVTIVVATALVFPGCAPAPAPTEGEIPPVPSGPWPEPNPYWGLGFKADGTPLEVVYICAMPTDVWHVNFNGYLRSLVERSGGKYSYRASNWDPTTEVAIWEDLLLTKPDVIVDFPTDPDAPVFYVEEAFEMGIPTFTVFFDINSDKVVSGTAGDDFEMGRLLGRYMRDYCEETNTTPVLLEVRGILGHPIDVGRHEGFWSAWEGYPEFEVHEVEGKWEETASMDVSLDALQAFPDINFITASCDSQTLGIKAALAQVGRWVPIGEPGHAKMMSIDGLPYTMEAVRNGYQWAVVRDAGIDHSSLMAKMIFTSVSLEKSVPKKLVNLPKLITEENAAQELDRLSATFTGGAFDQWPIFDQDQIETPQAPPAWAK